MGLHEIPLPCDFVIAPLRSRGHTPLAHGDLGTVLWLPTSRGAAGRSCLDCSSVPWVHWRSDEALSSLTNPLLLRLLG